MAQLQQKQQNAHQQPPAAAVAEAAAAASIVVARQALPHSAAGAQCRSPCCRSLQLLGTPAPGEPAALLGRSWRQLRWRTVGELEAGAGADRRRTAGAMADGLRSQCQAASWHQFRWSTQAEMADSDGLLFGMAFSNN